MYSKLLTSSLKANIQNTYGCDFNISKNYPIYHNHTFWEFTYLFAPVTHSINGKTVRLNGDTILIIRPEDCHCFTDCIEPIGQINFKITDENVRTITQYLDDDLYDILCNTSFENMSFPADDAFGKKIKKLQNNLLSHKITKQTFTLCKFAIVELLSYIYKKHLFRYSDNRYPEVIQTAIKRLSSPANFSAKINDLFGDLGYSYMQLYRLFKQHTGQTMSDFFLSAKMNYAANQLTNSNCKIIEIANLTGFATQGHFDTVFKKYYNISPKEYRKNSETNS